MIRNRFNGFDQQVEASDLLKRFRVNDREDRSASAGFEAVSDLTTLTSAGWVDFGSNYQEVTLRSEADSSPSSSPTIAGLTVDLAQVTTFTAGSSSAATPPKTPVTRTAPAVPSISVTATEFRTSEIVANQTASSLTGESTFLEVISELAGGLSASQIQLLRSLQYTQTQSKVFVSSSVSGIGQDFAAGQDSFVGQSEIDYHGSSCPCGVHGGPSTPAALGGGGGGGGDQNDFAPVVDAKDMTVEIGSFFAVSEMFTYLDYDQNPLQAIRVVDKGSSAASGYVVYNGSRIEANRWIEVPAANLNRLRFFAGLEPVNEAVGIMVSDGLFWSTADFARVVTVPANLFKPTAQGFDGSVLSGESVKLQDYILANDPENNLQKMRIIDRVENANSGFFSIAGVAQAQGQWFEVNVSQLSDINYHGGRNGQAEYSSFQVYDGKFWSNVANFKMTTMLNRFRPVVGAPDVTLESGDEIQVGKWLTFNDADGNTVKRYKFYDTGSRAEGGYFTLNGVVQAANGWFDVEAEDLNGLIYHASTGADFEKFRVMAFDGKYYSAIATGSVTVNVSPTTDLPDTIVLSELESVFLDQLFSVDGNGLGIKKVYVYEAPSITNNGGLAIQGSFLADGQVHELTLAEYRQLTYVGGPEDVGRHFDNFLISFDNGVAQSGWERVNTITEVVGSRALTSGTSWSANTGDSVVVTYSFPTTVPFYYADDADERTDLAQALSGTQRERVRDALQMYSDFANMTFVEVADAIGGTMRFMITDLPDGVQGWAYFPDPSLPRNSLAGDVWFDDALIGDTFAPGSEGWLTAIHEIGHAVGFSHPFVPAGESGTVLPEDTQSHLYTQMSYTRVSQLPFVRNDGTYGIDSLMLYDVIELQRLYGATESQNEGDTVYQWGETFRETIRDTSGVDTISAANFNTDQTIDLRPGRFSAIGVQSHSLMLTHDTVIENVISGGGSDRLFGNEANNFMSSGRGNDVLEGGGGVDFMAGGAGDDTYVWRLGDGWDIIDEDRQGGRDILQIYGNDSVDNRAYGTINELDQDFVFRRLGRDLRIDFTVDRGKAVGGVTIKDYAWGGSRVESIQFYGSDGIELTKTISLYSIFQQATDSATRFTLTDIDSPLGLVATPV